jgi:hypothetical protein
VNLLSGRYPLHFGYAACKDRIGRKPALFQGQRRKLRLAKTCDAPFHDFKAWNGFHDLMIKISSDVIAALRKEASLEG